MSIMCFGCYNVNEYDLCPGSILQNTLCFEVKIIGWNLSLYFFKSPIITLP